MSADLLGARYQLIRETTRTPSFTVHEAFDHSTGAAVGVAVDRDPSPATVLGRRSAGDRLARIRHPHVVSIADHGRHHGRDYVVFHAPERTLSAVLADGPAGPAILERVAPLLASGLTALHRAGLRLGQVHPGHVALDDSGTVQLAPWPFTDAPPGWGRPADWAAPEVVAARTPTVAGDVWSIGAMLLAILVGPGPGRLPAGSEASFVAPLQATADPGLLGVITRSMSADPERRFRSAAHLRAALGTIAGASSPAPAARAGAWLVSSTHRLVTVARSASGGGPSAAHRLRIAGGCSLAIAMLASAALATRTLDGVQVSSSFAPPARHDCILRGASPGSRAPAGCGLRDAGAAGNTPPSRTSAGTPAATGRAGAGRAPRTTPSKPGGAVVVGSLVAAAVSTAPAAPPPVSPPPPAVPAPMARPSADVRETPRPARSHVVSGDDGGLSDGPRPASSGGDWNGVPGGTAGTSTWGTDH